jgi:hypothetical protein
MPLNQDVQEALEDPKRRPPLGMPEGSVRAILALLVLAVIIVETVRGNHRLLEGLWSETLLIALAHYFTSRRMVGLPRSVRQRLEAEGYMPRDTHPLWLPRYSIRLILFVALAALTYYVVKDQTSFDLRKVPPILLIAWSYLLGVIVRGTLSLLNRGQTRSGLWADLQALAVLILMLATAIPYFLGHGDIVTEPWRNAALACVLFYFGSR